MMTRQKDIERVTARALSIVTANLERFGNHIGAVHREALRTMIHGMASLAFGARQGRIGYPLPTGCGKSQSAVALCAALHELGYSHITVAVAASRVEALCQFKRDLIAAGVPEHQIGLRHTYRFDTEKAAASADGFASLPNTPDSAQRQFLLLSHNKLRGGTPLIDYYSYNGHPRDLLIWDESLIVCDARAVSYIELRSSLGWIRERPGTEAKPVAYLDKALRLIDSELTRQKAGRKPRPVLLESLDGATIGEFKKGLTSDQHSEPLKRFLEMSQEQLRVVNTPQNGGLISYDIVVPRCLQRVAVLDASFCVRELARLDASIKLGMEVDHNLKRYDHVVIHRLPAPSGRTSMTADFLSSHLVCAEVIDVIKTIPPDEGVMIWTFKSRVDSRARPQVDFIGVFRRELTEAGIDVDATIPVNEGGTMVQRPRIVFRTWGQETSESKHSYISNMVFASTLHRSLPDIASYFIGQHDDLFKQVCDDDLLRIMHSETAYAIHQALGRGACRIVDGNQARPMNVWLLSRDRTLAPTLCPVMPGLRFLDDWEAKYLVVSIRSRLAAQIAQFLVELPPTTKCISILAMKRQMGVDAQEATRSCGRALADVLADPSTDWERRGRSLVRRWDWQPEAVPSKRNSAAGVGKQRPVAI